MFLRRGTPWRLWLRSFHIIYVMYIQKVFSPDLYIIFPFPMKRPYGRRHFENTCFILWAHGIMLAVNYCQSRYVKYLDHLCPSPPDGTPDVLVPLSSISFLSCQRPLAFLKVNQFSISTSALFMNWWMFLSRTGLSFNIMSIKLSFVHPHHADSSFTGTHQHLQLWCYYLL